MTNADISLVLTCDVTFILFGLFMYLPLVLAVIIFRLHLIVTVFSVGFLGDDDPPCSHYRPDGVLVVCEHGQGGQSCTGGA